MKNTIKTLFTVAALALSSQTVAMDLYAPENTPPSIEAFARELGNTTCQGKNTVVDLKRLTGDWSTETTWLIEISVNDSREKDCGSFVVNYANEETDTLVYREQAEQSQTFVGRDTLFSLRKKYFSKGE